MLKLNNLSSPKGAHRNIKRIGRGQGSGQGTQAGKGHKGQKARSGGGVRTGFEGGQTPLYRRLPKVGFNNAAFATEYAIVNLEKLATKFESSDEISRESLVEKGFLSGRNKKLPIKVLAKGDFAKALTFKGTFKFSKTAQKLVEDNKGKILEN